MRNIILAIVILILMGWIFYCTNTDGPRIEKDLTQRVTQSLQEIDNDAFSNVMVSADVRHLTLKGEVLSQSDVDKAVENTKKVYGVKTVKSLLTVKPVEVVTVDYQTGIQLQPESVVLNGMVPSEKEKTALVELAIKNYPGFEIIDRLTVQAGSPEGWQSAVYALVNQMRSFKRGNAVLFNKSIAVSGEVDSQEKANLATTSLRDSMAENFQLNPQIKVVSSMVAEAEVVKEEIKQQGLNCQKEFSRILNSGKIEFKTNSDEIQAISFTLLDSLVGVAGKCPSTLVDVVGHTDSQGDEKYNQQLSERRASSVVRYLVSKDINVNRLSSTGYGELQPIADNTTVSGRAKNRRIELKVKEN